MLRVEKQLDEQLAITLNQETAELLHSVLEFVARFDFEDKVTGEEIALSKVLSDELESYITEGVSEKIEAETIDYINGSYNYYPEDAHKFVELMAETLNTSGQSNS